MARLDFRGGAAKCTAAGSVSSGATTIALDGDTSGWPTGASGRNFVAVIDRGVAGKMEKVLCSDLTGGVLTIATRGFDGTSAVAHDPNATVEHGLNASLFDDLSAHMYDDTRDDHSQYSLVDGSRAFSALTAIAGAPVDIGTALANGTAPTLARSDHVHKIPAGFVTSAMIANGTIVSADIADGTIVAGDIAAGTLTQALMAAGLSIPIICTSGTRPTGSVGMTIYETDTGNHLEYHGATDTWRPPWNTAWGVLANCAAELTGNVAHIQATTLSGLTLTNITHVANRKLRLEASLTINASAPDNVVEVLFKKAGTQVHRHDHPIGPTTSVARPGVPLDSAAGTATWTVFVDNSVGTADLTLLAAADRKSWFRIIDEGPNGAPA